MNNPGSSSPMPPFPIAIAIVEQAGQVLIGRRPEGVALGGCWEFPGGKVEDDETPAAAAARECQEETGLAVRIVAMFDEVEYAYAHGLLHLFFFCAEPIDPGAEPREPYRWIAKSSLGDYAFPPANGSVLARLLNDLPK